MVACPGEKAIYRDAPFVLEHRPKSNNAKGIRYHIAQVVYGFGLFLTAIRFRANAGLFKIWQSLFYF